MSAGLTERDDGRIEMAYARSSGVPWHGLGVALDGETDSAGMIEAAGLDWRVSKRRVFVDIAPESDMRIIDERRGPIASHRAIVREDSGAVLGVVGAGFETWQNADALAFLDSLAADERPTYDTAGSLHGGAVCWALLNHRADYRVGDDAWRRFTLLTWGHDGAHAVRARQTDQRVVCGNTLGMALHGADANAGAGAFSIRHTRSLTSKLDAARELLAVSTEQSRRLRDWLAAAAVVRVEQRDCDAVVGALFPEPDDASTPRVFAARAVEVVRFRRDFANVERERTGRTALTLVNAITGYADHGLAYRKTGAAERRFESILIGGRASSLKARGLAVVAELVK